MNPRSVAVLMTALLCCACANDGDVHPTDPDIDRTIELDETATGGFDDWSSPGAALGYAVDAEEGLILVTALRFSLPFYEGSLSPVSYWGTVASEWEVRSVDPLADDVAAYPLLAAALTDTDGIRELPGGVAAVLLEGDFDAATPQRIWVSDHGEVTLTREDGGVDYLSGTLRLREVTALGDDADAGDGAVLVDGFAFSWDTNEQP